MKCLKFQEAYLSSGAPRYDIFGYHKAYIGNIQKVKVGRKMQYCLVSDDLAWWRPDCLRQVADFIDSLEICPHCKGDWEPSAHLLKVCPICKGTGKRTTP